MAAEEGDKEGWMLTITVIMQFLGCFLAKDMLSHKKATNMVVSRVFRRKLPKCLNTKPCRNALIPQDYQNCRRKLLTYLVKWHWST